MNVHHVTVDFTADPVVLGSRQLIMEFLTLCCSRLGMTPMFQQILPVDGPNPGLTGIMVITTSHITIHTFTKQGKAFADVFSCVGFDGYMVMDLIRSLFTPRDTRQQIIPRMDFQLVRS